MTTNKWATPNSIATALSTDLNSLGNGSYSAASAAIDNETDLYLYAEFELVLASLTPTGTPPSCVLYLLPSLDGTNFSDGSASLAPATSLIVAAFGMTTATAAKRIVSLPVLIPPLQFKVLLLNSTGVALASSGNTVKIRRFNEASA